MLAYFNVTKETLFLLWFLPHSHHHLEKRKWLLQKAVADMLS